MHDERTRDLINADRRQLVRAASRLLGPMDAEDAVQDAYVRALEVDLPRLNAAQAWLLTVVRNLSIDRLRRRQWMQQWLAQVATDDTVWTSPSAELQAGLTQEATRALALLARCLTPADGAAVLLQAVFEVSHAEMAQISDRSEASSRQQLRRALLRLQRAGGASEHWPTPEPESDAESVLRLYLQSLQLRDPRALWAMLRQPAVSAMALKSAVAADNTASAPHATACGVIQAGGQLGLVLTLDGVRLCVLPLGVRAERDTETAPA